YLRGRHTVGRARASFTRIVDAVTALGQGDWRW
ncbi:esterase, partial [Mesorhizobium sp. M7A.F.Ca.MR.228.00.0.0]